MLFEDLPDDDSYALFAIETVGPILRPYACYTCHKSFRRIHEVIAHQVVHKLTYDFACKYCDKNFKTGRSRDRHMREACRKNSNRKPRRYFKRLTDNCDVDTLVTNDTQI